VRKLVDEGINDTVMKDRGRKILMVFSGNFLGETERVAVKI
jgi:hypothetical protein